MRLTVLVLFLGKNISQKDFEFKKVDWNDCQSFDFKGQWPRGSVAFGVASHSEDMELTPTDPS